VGGGVGGVMVNQQMVQYWLVKASGYSGLLWMQVGFLHWATQTTVQQARLGRQASRPAGTHHADLLGQQVGAQNVHHTGVLPHTGGP
jgi:hypothetical protein